MKIVVRVACGWSGRPYVDLLISVSASPRHYLSTNTNGTVI